jgi:hypothetical protein
LNPDGAAAERTVGIGGFLAAIMPELTGIIMEINGLRKFDVRFAFAQK